MKTYNVIIDMTESFLCPIEAESEEKALEKAEGVNPSENNVPYYSEANVIGVRGDDYIINQSRNYVQAAEERGYKDTDTFELFKKDLDKVLEKHYPDTDYQWDFLDEHWIELKVWLREPIEEKSDEHNC